MQSNSAKDPDFKIQEPGRKLKSTEVIFMKLIEKENLKRVQQLQKLRRRNNITGLFLGGTVIGIYIFSMLRIQQETFLDDFEKPAKVSSE